MHKGLSRPKGSYNYFPFNSSHPSLVPTSSAVCQSTVCLPSLASTRQFHSCTCLLTLYNRGTLSSALRNQIYLLVYFGLKEHFCIVGCWESARGIGITVPGLLLHPSTIVQLGTQQERRLPVLCAAAGFLSPPHLQRERQRRLCVKSTAPSPSLLATAVQHL